VSTQIIDLFEALKRSLEENPIMPETNETQAQEPVLLSAEQWGEYNVAREAFDAWKKRRDKARAACAESFRKRWAGKLQSTLNKCPLTERSAAQLERYMIIEVGK
jgi:hypothetical protein